MRWVKSYFYFSTERKQSYFCICEVHYVDMSQVKRYDIHGTFEDLFFIFCKLVAKGFLLNEKYLL
jgi:hypothetical protein